MDDYLEIDIKKLIMKIISRWYWIAGVTFLVCVATFLFFSRKPDMYQAKAMIALVRPTIKANFSTNITTIDLPLPSEGFITNAVKSNEIMTALFAEWNNENKATTTLDTFIDQHLSVTLDSKGAVIILKATFANPEEAARIANAWAGLAVKLINTSYYGIMGDVGGYFELQIAEAKSKLDQSGKDLEDFAKTNNSTLLKIRLSNLNAEVADITQRRMTLEAAQFDLNGMIIYLQQFPVGDQVREADMLNFTLVQTRVYGSPVVAGLAGSPVQLQLSVQSTQEKTTNEQFIQIIKDWNATLSERIKILNADNSKLYTEIMAIESQLVSLENQKTILQAEYDLRMSLLKNLKGELQELLLKTSNASYGNAQVLSSAIVPETSIPHNTVKNTLIAFFASIVLTSISILLIDWWKSDKKIEEHAQD